MASFDSVDWLIAAAVAMLLAMVGYMYWEVASRSEPPEVVAPADP